MLTPDLHWNHQQTPEHLDWAWGLMNHVFTLWSGTCPSVHQASVAPPPPGALPQSRADVPLVLSPRAFLQAGKHVCVEYPMALSCRAAVDLWDLASQKGECRCDGGVGGCRGH